MLNQGDSNMKIISFILTLTIFLGCCVSITGCGSNNDTNDNQSALKEVSLTKDNFEDYFTIDVNSDVDITKHGGNYVLGVYIYPTYSGVADVDVNVSATTPLESYNVSVTLEVTTGYVYWNKEYITLNLNSSGSASKSMTITTSDDKEILLETDCKKTFKAYVTDVEGTIKIK